ncbi:MAG: ribosome maturation factor RimP [Gammaproteobacteria bacterium]|nr:ribosome maturation factor RimP [Gammaproteobacteria bacterium]
MEILTHQQWIDLLEPTVKSLGYELVEVESRTTQGLLRLYIDWPAGSDKGIGLEDCECVSRQVSGILDVNDPIAGKYRLEVSSPGTDRPLRTAEHFEQFIGHEVKLNFNRMIEGAKRKRGRIVAVDDDTVRIAADDGEQSVAISHIAKARLVPSF